jgi:hypothetical protein
MVRGEKAALIYPFPPIVSRSLSFLLQEDYHTIPSLRLDQPFLPELRAIELFSCPLHHHERQDDAAESPI